MSDLDCEEGVGETDGRSLYGFWGQASGGAEGDVGVNARGGVDYGVVGHSN